MSKTRAILFFGALTLIVAGYLGWCSRTFWMHAEVPALPGIPGHQRVAAEAAIEASGLTSPDPFSFRVLLGLLMNPFDTQPRSVNVNPDSPITLYVYRTRRSSSSPERPVIFIRAQGEDWAISAHHWNGVFYPGKALGKQ